MRTLRNTLATLIVTTVTGVTLISPTGAYAETTTPSPVSINEIIYDKASGYSTDQVELFNTGTEPVDLTGWQIADDKKEFETLPAGLTIEPGGYLMLLNGTHFSFGLGKGDAVYLRDAANVDIDGYAYANTAPLLTWARCPDGTGEWAPATVVTPGSANQCAPLSTPGEVVLNEVDSQPADWVELFNPGGTAVQIGGYELRDNSDDHRFKIAEGTVLEPGAFLVIDADTAGSAYDDQTLEYRPSTFGAAFGLGGADTVRLYDTAGELIDQTEPWTAHAMIDGSAIGASYARCVDGKGPFMLAYASPGMTNSCVLPSVVVNEVESNGDATDWVEIMNVGSTDVDLSGWIMLDNDPVGHAGDVTPVPAGTILKPGEVYVFDGATHFAFGLGANDVASVRNASRLVVAEYAWTTHATGVYGRCPNGTGPFLDLEVSTKGLPNACGNPVRINEVESDGSPDWVELVNPTSRELDVSGIVVKDDDDAHSFVIPEGTTIAPNGYLVLDALGFGLGKADIVRLFDGDQLIDTTQWGPSHSVPTWGRCPDTSGTFAQTASETKGQPNVCAGEIVASPWPGLADTQVLDRTPQFLKDSSGLDTEATSDGVVLWAVDNGTGRFFKLNVAADGTTSFAKGWEQGKRARFQKDAEVPSAPGPDAEGITVAGDGFLYLAAERDNSAKGVNYNVVLQVDPNSPETDVVARTEWDLTQVLPQVGANLGMEAIEWVSDAELQGKLWDRNTGAPYDPAAYPGHGDGLFFVGIEDQGQVFALALYGDGTAAIVAEVKPGLGGVMALDWDTVLGVLWAVCDDGCAGTSAQITLNGTDTPGVEHFLRPSGLPNINNEGFATAPAALISDGRRPAWWFADGFSSESLRLGWLNAKPGSDPNDGGNGEVFTPLPGDQLTDGNRGGIDAPESAVLGSEILVKVPAELEGSTLSLWLYSTPRHLGSPVVTNGAVQVTIPADATPGLHRIAAYDSAGKLIGWDTIRLIPAATTGAGGVPIGSGAAAGSATPKANGSSLAATGTDGTQELVVFAGLMLLAGALLTGVSARRAAGHRTIEVDTR